VWSDNETNVDLLRYAYLASGVSRIVRSEHLLPTTVGVFGNWGSGKSSLLQMIRANLEKDPGMMCLAFDGWLFEGYEDAKTALMGTILDAIEDRIGGDATLWEKVKERFTALRQRVNWLRLAAMTGRVAIPVAAGSLDLSGGVDPSGVAADVAAGASTITPSDAQSLLNAVPEGEENLRRNIRDFRRDFGKLLEEAEIGTLVVFIDDLDRCMPDTIIETLEAIKLFLFAPGTAFIIGADERLVEYAVRLRFPELPNTEIEVGRNYLEKLVQFPIRIPPLNGVEVQSYANLLFAQLDLGPNSENYKKVCNSVAQSGAASVSELSFDIQAARNLLGETVSTAELEKDFDLVAQVAPVIAPGLSGNPRRVKRFLNTLLLRMAMGEDRGLNLQRQVLAKLMLLEYVKPEFFKKLAELQATQDGRPTELVAAETHLRRSDFGEGDDAREVAGRKTAEKQSASESKGSRGTRTEGKPPRFSDQELPTDVQPWLAEDWMRSWLTWEPFLEGIDLRPYFYVAHDKVGALDGSPLRLTPAAAEVLNRLLSDQDATRRLGLRRSEQLNASEATALFQDLAERVRRAESLGPGSPQVVLFELMDHRHELLPQLVALYDSLPETKIILETPGLLFEATKGSASVAAARGVVERWSRSTAKLGLARAAQTILSRPWEGN
jgi:hypothetical protein